MVFLSVCVLIPRAITATNAGWNSTKQEPLALLLGMKIRRTIMESNMEISQKKL
jgi:hypothetical protein